MSLACAISGRPFAPTQAVAGRELSNAPVASVNRYLCPTTAGGSPLLGPLVSGLIIALIGSNVFCGTVSTSTSNSRRWCCHSDPAHNWCKIGSCCLRRTMDVANTGCLYCTNCQPGKRKYSHRKLTLSDSFYDLPQWR